MRHIPWPLRPSNDGFHHPCSEAQLIALVRQAARERKQLRVRGSAHSVADAIHTSGGVRAGHIDVMLDRYSRILAWDEARRQVTVEAGCHFGDDPRDETGMATWERSLLAALEARGWALPDLGGVTHQTIAGFFSTGSSGGSVQHSIVEAIVRMRVIDGTGELHELEREHELFDALRCSMGLLGVISTVTLQCVAHYDVIGQETICDDTQAPYQLFEDGPAGFAAYLRETEYTRALWWPQHGVRRIVTWSASRMTDEQREARSVHGQLRVKPYQAFGDAIANPRLAALADRAGQHAAGALFDAMAHGRQLVRGISHYSSLAGTSAAGIGDAFARQLLPHVISGFVPRGQTQEFWGSWSRVLPMDNNMSERALPTEFTELWLPLDRASEVMRALQHHYEHNGHDATGSFACELYAARANTAWMHPGYGRDSLRVDLFWFARNFEDPTTSYFKQFWRLLLPFDYRLHWGKYLPRERELCADHLRRVTPRWDDFMAARARLDPHRVFLSRYWADALGLS